MFKLFSSSPVVEAAPCIRRVIDLTTPNRPVGHDLRTELRYCRSLPALLSFANRGVPDASNSCMAISQDLSDRGLRLLTFEPIAEGEHCVSIWPNSDEFESPFHVLCSALTCSSLAQGIWSTGFLIKSLLENDKSKSYANLDLVARRALRPTPKQD